MTDPSVNGHDRPDELPVRALESAIAALREQLDRKRGGADRAEQRVEELHLALTEERRRVIEILTERRPWWRRWFR